MQSLLDLLASPALIAASATALALPVVTGFPTWPALARGRLASTVCPSVAAGTFVYLLVSRLAAPAAG